MSDIQNINPTFEQVRDLIKRWVELAKTGWIGEANDFAEELLNYIDGKNDQLLKDAEYAELRDAAKRARIKYERRHGHDASSSQGTQ